MDGSNAFGLSPALGTNRPHHPQRRDPAGRHVGRQAGTSFSARACACSAPAAMATRSSNSGTPPRWTKVCACSAPAPPTPCERLAHQAAAAHTHYTRHAEGSTLGGTLDTGEFVTRALRRSIADAAARLETALPCSPRSARPRPSSACSAPSGASTTRSPASASAAWPPSTRSPARSARR